jgi:hypothetical protein
MESQISWVDLKFRAVMRKRSEVRLIDNVQI